MKLYVAMNLAFACSMRYGEICGLTWDKVHISDEDIANDDSHLWIEQELARVSREARQQLDDKDIMFIFPSVMSNTHINLVLNTADTEILLTKDICLIFKNCFTFFPYFIFCELSNQFCINASQLQ